MKKFTCSAARTTVVVLVMAFTTASVFASNVDASSRSVNWKKAEQNYVISIGSDNTGVRMSAISYIGEYRLTGAAKNVIAVLQEDSSEELRMAAALTLISIGDEAGIKAVADAAKNDGSEKVARFCLFLLGASNKSAVVSVQ